MNILQRRPAFRLESFLLVVVLALTLCANIPLWQVLAGNVGSAVLLAVFALAAFLHYALLAVLTTQGSVRPVLSILFPLSAVVAYYIGQYGVVIDPGMVRNVIQTDMREATELLNGGLLLALLPALLAVALVWWVRISQPLSWKACLLSRSVTLLILFLAAILTVLSCGREFSALMRNQPSLRYMMTPGNVVYSTVRVVSSDAKEKAHSRDPAEPASRVLAVSSKKPLLLVMVVGETARAANFSLNGYARQTNPELEHLPIVNYSNVKSCGTSTEVSLPCMFSPFGRTDYDEARIHRHESLLHLVQRAGVPVQWLDNQSGCKGVCADLDFADLSHSTLPDLCKDGHCYDGILIEGLKNHVATHSGDQMVVLHQIGNHGPAYASRYPAEFEKFKPACRSSDLGKCSTQEIINAYDNGILYTDHVLAGLIHYLDGLQKQYDVALLYVSDHGESLGEHGLFLHGMPYSIAPREQTSVPMLWWLPQGTAARLQLNTACLAENAKAPASHDNLFHSLLGLLDIQTPRYRRADDLLAQCRTPVKMMARVPVTEKNHAQVFTPL